MQPKGGQEKAKAQVQQGIKLLKDAITMFQYGSEEFEALDKALSALIKKFPAGDAQSIAPAQLVNMLSKPGGG